MKSNLCIKQFSKKLSICHHRPFTVVLNSTKSEKISFLCPVRYISQKGPFKSSFELSFSMLEFITLLLYIEWLLDNIKRVKLLKSLFSHFFLNLRWSYRIFRRSNLRKQYLQKFKVKIILFFFWVAQKKYPFDLINLWRIST